MLTRCGSEWSAQNERTTPTQMDAVSAPSRATRASASRAGGASASAAQAQGQPAGECGASSGRRAWGRGERGSWPRGGRRATGSTRAWGRRRGGAEADPGRRQGRGGAEAEPGARGGGGPSRGARGAAAASWRKKIRCRGKKEKTIEDDTWGPYVTVANGVKCRSIPSLRIPPTKQKTGFDPTLQPNTNWVQPNPKIWVGLNPSPI